MGDWTNATRSTSTDAGVLRPERLAQLTTLTRYPAGPRIQRWVENYWTLRWDLPPGASYDSQVLPHPACTLSVERGGARPETGGDAVVVTGVVTRRFDVRLSGRAWVLGVKFRPGGLAALTGRPARPWRDTVAPAQTILPGRVVDRLEELDGHRSDPDSVALAEQALVDLAGSTGRPVDDRYNRLLAVVTDMLVDRTLVRVAQVEERHDISTRALQRLFYEYVGVGPKWVLARYRMHDAVSAINDGHTGSLTDLAHVHGWYDQAHFIRDFTALVGVTPGQYRQGQAAPDAGA